MIAAACVGDGPDRRHPGFLCQQVCLFIAPALVVGDEVRDVSGRGGLAIGADLAGTLIGGCGEQFLLGAKWAQHGLDGHSSVLIVPIAGDQPYCAKRRQALGVGRVIWPAERNAAVIRAAVRTVLGAPAGRRRRYRARAGRR